MTTLVPNAPLSIPKWDILPPVPVWHVVIDFETYYSIKDGISVSSQGINNYIRDTYAYMLSIVAFKDPENMLKTAKPDFQWVGTLEELENIELPFGLADSVQPWAANSNFDEAFWNKYFPEFARQWLCILDLGKHHQLPAHLAGLAQAVLGQKLVDKTLRDEMDGVHYRDLSPEKKQALLQYCLTDSVIEARVLVKLLHDAPPGSVFGMSPIEYKVAGYTRMTSKRGVQIDVDLLNKDIQTLELTLFEATAKIPWSGDTDKKGKPVKLLSMTQLHKWCSANDIPAPESRAKGNDELDELMSDHPKLKEIIGYMRMVNSLGGLLEKARACEARADENGIMPLEMLYCGAPHTRRWSSRGFNVQNLHQFPVPMTEAGTVELEELKKKYGDQAWQYFDQGVWSRRWIIPRKGKKFVILDFAQIEPRCSAWLTDNQAMMENIRRGFNIYEAHARATMGWTGGSLKKEDPRKYKLAKIRCLSLGYGSGAVKFLVAARKEGLYEVFEKEAQGLLGQYIDPETQKPLDLEEIVMVLAQANVQDYRRQNTAITGMWKTMDEALETALRAPGDHNLDLQMPSGENLRHWFCRRMPKTVIDPETGEKKTKWSWMTLTVKGDPRSASYNVWGGFIFQNCIQRMARDVLAPSLLEIERSGRPVLWSSHDEAIIEVEADKAEAELEACKQIMRTAPSWAPDLPLEVAGDIFSHYVK
jgi:hypothetical protein